MKQQKIEIMRQWIKEEFQTEWVEFKASVDTWMDDYQILNTAWLVNGQTKVCIIHNYPANISVSVIIQYKGAHAFTCRYDDSIGKLGVKLDRLDIHGAY